MPSSIHQTQNLIWKMPPGRWGYVATGSAAIFFIYALIIVMHRLYFSPLASFSQVPKSLQPPAGMSFTLMSLK